MFLSLFMTSFYIKFKKCKFKEPKYELKFETYIYYFKSCFYVRVRVRRRVFSFRKLLYFSKFKVLRYLQSHYIEVAQGDIFMEQKVIFGLVLGQLATLKKKLSNFWGWFFHVFRGNFFFFKYCSVRTKKLNKMKSKEI